MKHKPSLSKKSAPLISKVKDAPTEKKIKPLYIVGLVIVVLFGASVASGVYNDYVIRSRVANLLPAAHDAKAAVEWYLKHMGPLPVCDTKPEVNANTTGFTEVVPGAMKYVNKLWLNYNCVIELKGETQDIASNIPGSLSLILCPTLNSGEVEWTCMYYDSNAEKGPWTQYVPKQCQKPFYWNGAGMDTCGH
jgi:hypothetical protein